jgi:phage baseplate assembly protein W
MTNKNVLFPLVKSNTNGYFNLTETTLENLKQNIAIMFATDIGERVVNNQLGSKFRSILFDPSNTENIQTICSGEVSRIFNTFFPQLNLDVVNVKYLDDTNTTQNAVEIFIQYSLKSVETIQDSLTVAVG